MSVEKLKPNFTFHEDRLNALREIIAEAFADGKINILASSALVNSNDFWDYFS